MCCGVFLEIMTSQAHAINWRKLLENATKLVRPNGVQRPKRALAQSSRAWSARKGCLWQAFSGKRAGRPRIAEASNVPLANFCLQKWHGISMP